MGIEGIEYLAWLTNTDEGEMNKHIEKAMGGGLTFIVGCFIGAIFVAALLYIVG